MTSLGAATISSFSAGPSPVLAFQTTIVNKPGIEPFSHNLDHLKALENEASLILAITYLRRNTHGLKEDKDYFFPSFLGISSRSTPEEVQKTLSSLQEENRKREELSLKRNIPLNFLSFCADWSLDYFERSVVMLLLMQSIAPDFISLYSDCNFEKKGSNGMEIGNILSLLCDDLGKQLECRRYFSVISPLMRNDIVTVNGGIDDTTNILNEKIYLCERFVRFILGDNNLYNSFFRYIKQEKCHVKLEQVILNDNLKEEIVHSIDRYLAGRSTGGIHQLDSFFGYGTALTLLFHGPSGTGKTMMARAIATHFDRPIFSLSAIDLREMCGSYTDILATLFREAALHGAIVFLDECDDVFVNNGSASRALLIEIEKARCIVIMATNKPVALDPALERRITMKVHFPIPGAEKRSEMWKSLMPDTVQLAADIDLLEFAERYHFTGGLIRNSIFLAINGATGIDGPPLLTAEGLHRAAAMQTATLADEQNICRTYAPIVELDKLPLVQRQCTELKNISNVWKSLHERQTGLALIISASDISTAIQAAEGVAKECALKVRAFDYRKVISMSPEDMMADPATQRKILPLDYAFSPAASDAAITLFIDYEGELDKMLESSDNDKLGHILRVELINCLRRNRGLFIMVSKLTNHRRLPTEFNLMINLEHPSEEFQLKHWEQLLGGMTIENEHGLTKLTRESSMHLNEIDYIVRQAGILATIRRLACQPNIDEIKEVITGYHKKQNTPLLFGG